VGWVANACSGAVAVFVFCRGGHGGCGERYREREKQGGRLSRLNVTGCLDLDDEVCGRGLGYLLSASGALSPIASFYTETTWGCGVEVSRAILVHGNICI
jgi:hypothetical protein